MSQQVPLEGKDPVSIEVHSASGEPTIGVILTHGAGTARKHFRLVIKGNAIRTDRVLVQKVLSHAGRVLCQG